MSLADVNVDKDLITACANVLVDMTRRIGRANGNSSMSGTINLDVELPDGGCESWLINIARRDAEPLATGDRRDRR